jgi:hypothetical protein
MDMQTTVHVRDRIKERPVGSYQLPTSAGARYSSRGYSNP